MLYIKIDPKDKKTHWNTYYHEIGILRDSSRLLKGGLRARQWPLGAHKLFICQFLRIIGILYNKIDPKDRETHWNTSGHEICM